MKNIIIKTNIMRKMTLTENEIKSINKKEFIEINDIGNNWMNLSSKSKVNFEFAFDMIEGNAYLKSGTTVNIEVNKAVVSLHDYKEANILNYDEQEVHCVDCKFRILNVNFDDDINEVYISLEQVLENEFELSSNNEVSNYYQELDEMYLKEVWNYDEEDIEDYLS